jgi:lipopolysaccharide/colanic/teichoic acid biosynthesis glycosyltransferase
VFLKSKTKRAFDLIGCFVSLWIFGPIGAFIALAIFLEERKSVLFVQERIGFLQNSFKVYKFRTMTDGQVTWVGSWLRKTGLDELPQYLNVVRGDISIVGPRPLTQFDIDRLQWRHHGFRWRMKPGLTGLAQVRSGKGAEHSLKADREYFESASLLLDCKIIVISFMMNIFGKRFVQKRFQRSKS